MELSEPLTYFYQKHGLETTEIEGIYCGEKYCLVILKNGNLGLCATLGNKVCVSPDELKNPDLGNTGHRIVINAYYNALLNYRIDFSGSSDIFDKVDFNRCENLVMIGIFRPLLRKFNAINKKIKVFDLHVKEPSLSPIENLPLFLGRTDAVILTATSIFNKTFMSITEQVRTDCDIFLLGPSSVMSPEMFNYRNIKVIFGAIFEKFDQRVIDLVSEGHGSKHFLPLGRKVFLEKNIL